MAISDAMSMHEATFDIIETVQNKNGRAPIAVAHELSEKLRDVECNAIRNAIAFILKELYDRDVDSLERDIAKVNLLVTEEVHTDPSERLRLLQIYWWIISTYFEGNIGLLVDMCKKEERP